MIIDTHCHYNLEPLFSGKSSHFTIKEDDKILKQNWKNHWQNAQKKGVKKSIVVGTNAKTSQIAIDIAKQEKNLFATVGIHPTEAENIVDINSEVEIISNLAKNNSIIALGEIGLDYFRLNDSATKKSIIEKQKELFSLQLSIAVEYNLPIIIHCRDKNISEREEDNYAYWDVIKLLRKNQTKIKKFVLHCVSGPLSYVIEALDLGGYVGFDGNITYKKASELKKLLRYSPFNRVLIETDAPYLPPQNHRGKICEPWMIVETAQYLEQEFGIDEETLLENTKNFFDI